MEPKWDSKKINSKVKKKRSEDTLLLLLKKKKYKLNQKGRKASQFLEFWDVDGKRWFLENAFVASLCTLCLGLKLGCLWATRRHRRDCARLGGGKRKWEACGKLELLVPSKHIQIFNFKRDYWKIHEWVRPNTARGLPVCNSKRFLYFQAVV